jgi:hypothetical protein
MWTLGKERFPMASTTHQIKKKHTKAGKLQWGWQI